MKKDEECETHQAIWEDWEIMQCGPCKEVNPLEESDADDANEEGENPRLLRDPGLPSRKDREEHDVTHIPYRSWCSHCVRGSGRDAQSRTIKGEMAHSDVPRVHLDYCFFTEDSKDEQEKQ